MEVADRPAAENYHVGWICALEVEYSIACELLEKEFRPPSLSRGDHNIYSCGIIAGHHVVVSCLPMGKYGLSSATSVAKDMLRSFPELRFGLMVGIGGGCPSDKNDIRLGDVVVSAPVKSSGGVIHYEFGKTIQERDFERSAQLNAPPKALLGATQQLFSLHQRRGHCIQETIEGLLQNNRRLRPRYERPRADTDILYEASFVHPDDSQGCQDVCVSQTDRIIYRKQRSREDNDPVIHHGLIASADKLMKDAKLRDHLASTLGVLCFEMEAAGLMDDFNCIVIRGICDYSDSHKNDVWHGYAAATAAAYAMELLQNIPVEATALPPLVSGSSNLAQDSSRADHTNIHDTDILASLAFPGMYQRRKNVEHAHPETCTWMFELQEYKRFDLEPHGLLWVKGKPGAGKSTIMAHLYDHLKEAHRDQFEVVQLDFFFHGRGTVLQKTAIGMFRSLLHQIFNQCPDFRPRIRIAYSENAIFSKESHKVYEWQLQELKDLFDLAIASLLRQGRQIRIFVDALDEAGRDAAEHIAKHFLHINSATVPSDRLKIYISCRHYPNLPKGKATEISVESHNGDDIAKFVHDELFSELNKDLSHSKEWQALQEELRSRACGVFQWVRLVTTLITRSYRNGDSLKTIQSWLQHVPQELGDVYEYILRHIIEPDRKVQSFRLFQWVCFAERPLTVCEMRYALSASEARIHPRRVRATDTSVFIETDRQMKRHIRALSGGLVEVVQLDAMTSSQTPKNKTPIPYGDDDYSDTDQSGITFNGFGEEQKTIESNTETFNAGTITNRSVYNSDSDSGNLSPDHSDQELIVRSRAKRPRPSMVVQFVHQSVDDYLSAGGFSVFANCFSKLTTNFQQTSGIHDSTAFALLCQYSCFEACLLYVATENILVDKKQPKDNWPWLQYAAQHVFTHGRKADAAVRRDMIEEVNLINLALKNLITAAEVIDVQQISKWEVILLPGMTIWHAATAANMLNTLNALLVQDCAGINAMDNYGLTPFSLACSRGFHEAAVFLLEQAGADMEVVGTVDDWGLDLIMEDLSPLYLATRSGSWTIVKWLIEKKAFDPQDVGSYDSTLIAAIQSRKIDIVRLLFAKGIDANAQYGPHDRSAVHIAVEYNNYDLLSTLVIDAGIDVNIQDRRGETALLQASRMCSADIVSMLISAGADVRYENNDQTALSIAFGRQYNHLVSILLEAGASMKSLSPECCLDSLWQTSVAANKDLVSLLLENTSVDVNAPVDYTETTVLYEAIQTLRSEEIISMLLEAGANPNSETRYGETPLQKASYFGLKGIVQMLLNVGAAPNGSARATQCTPLQCAIDMQNVESPVTMYQSGASADLSIHDEHLNNAYEHELQDRAEIVSILLEAGADPNFPVHQDRYGTPLQEACRLGSVKMVSMLLEAGADVRATSQKIKETTLEIAFERNNNYDMLLTLRSAIRTPSNQKYVRAQPFPLWSLSTSRPKSGTPVPATMTVLNISRPTVYRSTLRNPWRGLLKPS